ncbi:MAG TPA: hypothetical protein VGQ65_13740 [Thermoanaerobaculia bacterium]|jgi:hypothetical protein|nr:hypothetical protein [Thermoanaerobaculia bacterium]
MAPTPANDEEAVRDAFVRWASVQAAAPAHAEGLIENVQIAHEYAGQLDSEIDGRRVVWKAVPAAARARVTAAALAIGDVDAWNIDPAALRQRSDHVAICSACAGEKKLRCTACSGGKTRCAACNGQRKAYGYASNGAYRLLNCTACRGKGEIDCGHCRRGIAVCTTCAGEGRLQCWMEVESWQRSISKSHPETSARQFAWGDRPANEALARDAELLHDIGRPRALSRDDAASVPEEWLAVLRPEISAEERVSRERLRIVRIPTRIVHYRLGSIGDSVTFHGRQLLAPDPAAQTAFDRRAARLRVLRRVLIAIAIVISVASLARDAFFRSIPTLLSLLACFAALVLMERAAAEWTAARRYTRALLIAAGASFVVAIIFAIAALPRVAHAQRLIASGDIAAAESELLALHENASPAMWADLNVGRIRQAGGIDAARHALAQIPRSLPQYAVAVRAVDERILETARDDAKERRWSDASRALALLSDGARERSEAAAVAESVCIPAASEKTDRGDWSGAADAIVTARRMGVRAAALEPLDGAIHSAAIMADEKARHANDARERLRQRLAGENAFVSWERATENWGTPPLIALRAAMARDVAAVERNERRHQKQ